MRIGGISGFHLFAAYVSIACVFESRFQMQCHRVELAPLVSNVVVPRAILVSNVAVLAEWCKRPNSPIAGRAGRTMLAMMI